MGSNTTKINCFNEVDGTSVFKVDTTSGIESSLNLNLTNNSVTLGNIVINNSMYYKNTETNTIQQLVPIESDWIRSGNDISYTRGNVSVGDLRVSNVSAGAFVASSLTSGSVDFGNLRATNISAGAFVASSLTSGSVNFGDLRATNISAGNISAGNVNFGDLLATNISAGNISAGNISFSGQLLQNGLPFTSGGSDWAKIGNNISYTGGNVGIGTTSPQRTLMVQQVGSSTSQGWNSVPIEGYSVSGGSYLRMKRSSTSNGEVGYAWVTGTGTESPSWIAYCPTNSNDLRFYSTGDRLTLRDNGNVGIGTTSPGQRLQVNGNILLQSGENGFNETGSKFIGLSSNNYTVNVNGCTGMEIRTVGTFNQNIHFWNNQNGINQPRPTMTLLNNQNVGIGTTSPVGKLDVTYFAISANQNVLSLHTADTGTREYNLIEAGHGAGTDFVLRGTGRVGVGTTSPSQALHVVGQILATDDITAFSDARLKKDIVTIESALDKACSLRGVYYTNKTTENRGTGVIAQEVQQVLPEVVHQNGDYLSVAYGNIVGILIESIKELRLRVEQLENRNN